MYCSPLQKVQVEVYQGQQNSLKSCLSSSLPFLIPLTNKAAMSKKFSIEENILYKVMLLKSKEFLFISYKMNHSLLLCSFYVTGYFENATRVISSI